MYLYRSVTWSASRSSGKEPRSKTFERSPRTRGGALGTSCGVCRLVFLPDDWKAMTSVGSGVYEIRIHTELEHRVLYVAKHDDAVYVLHAF